MFLTWKLLNYRTGRSPSSWRSENSCSWREWILTQRSIKQIHYFWWNRPIKFPEKWQREKMWTLNRLMPKHICHSRPYWRMSVTVEFEVNWCWLSRGIIAFLGFWFFWCTTFPLRGTKCNVWHIKSVIRVDRCWLIPDGRNQAIAFGEHPVSFSGKLEIFALVGYFRPQCFRCKKRFPKQYN